MSATEGLRTTRSGRRRPGGLVVLLLAMVLFAAACSGSDDTNEAASADGSEESAEFVTEAASGDFDTEAMEDEEEAMEDEAAAEPTSGVEGDADTLGAGGAAVTPSAADLGRQLIFTAFVQIEVDDVAAAGAEATAIVEAQGGFLFGQSTEGGAQASSELTFKVLPDDFNAVLDALGSVGDLRNQSVTTDDVTERIVDLDSRIEVAELGVTRLREALNGSATLEDFAEIERLLLERETDLELMRGQRRTLQDRVDLATITLLLTQDRVENDLTVNVTSYPGFDAGASCPGDPTGRVEEGGEHTVCFDVINSGDQTLTDIVITDTVLGIDADTTLLPVFGSLEELPPGQAALVAFEVSPERSLVLRTRVVAVPTDGVSTEPVGPSVSTQVTHEIRTFEPDRDPGFGDGFGAAIDILRGLWVVVLVAVGFIIPLLVLLPLVVVLWLGARALRRRFGPAPTPPPPPPAPPAPKAEVEV